MLDPGLGGRPKELRDRSESLLGVFCADHNKGEQSARVNAQREITHRTYRFVAACSKGACRRRQFCIAVG